MIAGGLLEAVEEVERGWLEEFGGVDAALAGLGLFYTADWHVGPLIGNGRLVEVMTDWPVADQGGVYVLTSAIVGTPSKTRSFSDWIARGLAKPPWNATAAKMPAV